MAKREDEGPRSFAHMLIQVSDGEAEIEASAALHEVIRTCTERARLTNQSSSGEVTVKFKTTVDPRGIAAVVYDVTSKLPRAKRVASTMWVTNGGNLSVENPRQAKLPLIDVSQAQETRDVNNKTGEVISL